MPEDDIGLYFTFFNEIGIIEQLSRNMFEAVLPDGILVSHFSVLNNLTRVRDGRTPLELATAFQVPKTTMTHTLAGLETRGLVEIRRNPDDGRSKQVWLTPEGRAFREMAIKSMASEVASIREHIPPQHVNKVLPILEAVRIYLDRSRD